MRLTRTCVDKNRKERRRLFLHAIAVGVVRDYADNCVVEPSPDWRDSIRFSGGIGDQSNFKIVVRVGGFNRLQISRAHSPNADGRVRLCGRGRSFTRGWTRPAANVADERGLYAGDLRLCRCWQLPPPEIVIKHLSPIVFLERYDGDRLTWTESTGQVTLDIGLGLPAALWRISRTRTTKRDETGTLVRHFGSIYLA